jgi:hypothetical protein
MMIPCSWVRDQKVRVRVEHSTVDCMCLANTAGEAVPVRDIGQSKPPIQQPGTKAEIDPVLRLGCAMLLYY